MLEGDESDRTVASLPARIAVITNVDLDHHTTFGSRAEVVELSPGGSPGFPDVEVVRGDALEPSSFRSPSPGSTTAATPPRALAALELAGVARSEAEAAIVEFRGAGRRLEARGEAGGCSVLDDYAHHPTELAATIAAARELTPDGRIVVLFQPHLFSRTLLPRLARSPTRWPVPTPPASPTSTPRARSRFRGVTGKLLVDRLCERRPGMPVGWAPTPADAVAIVAAQARPGGIVLTAGAGDVDAPSRRSSRLDGREVGSVEEGVALSRYTTLGTGGPRGSSPSRLPVRTSSWSCSRGRAAEGLEAAPVGLGSNLLVADEGFPGLALKLSGDLAAAPAEGERLIAGGGASLAVCLHRARDAGPRRLRVRVRDPRARSAAPSG